MCGSFFPERDWPRTNTAIAFPFLLFCFSGGSALNLTDAEFAQLYASATAAFVRVGRALNACGVWPIFSLGGAMAPAIAKDRGYISSEQPFVAALARAGVSWARYYEFFSWFRAGYGIANALNESAQGVPSVMHAYPSASDGSITFALASFLIVQREFSYFGSSAQANGGANCSSPWVDCAWVWHDAYDLKFGAPLGPARAVGKGSSGVWTRSFANATVMVDEPRTHANITMGRGADAFSIVYTGGGAGEKREER